MSIPSCILFIHLKQVMEQLDKYIIGQSEAKRAVAIALRNRWRRQHLPEDMRKEVIPKNILMIGPTGCGKTEIVRRVSLLTESPFVKVVCEYLCVYIWYTCTQNNLLNAFQEATKFTEVGFKGKDVESMISDLLEASIKLTKERLIKKATAEMVNCKLHIYYMYVLTR